MENIIVFAIAIFFALALFLVVSTVGVFGASLLFPSYVVFNFNNVVGLALVSFFIRLVFLQYTNNK